MGERPEAYRDRAAEALRSWDGPRTVMIINPDIDGLLTAALLHDEFGWPVVGYYDTAEIMVARAWATSWDPPGILPRGQVVWADLDMCAPGTRSIGQHVNRWHASDKTQVSAYATSLNPNDITGVHGSDRARYRDKYPFGTFQYLAWLLHRFEAADRESWWSFEAEGLVWMPDGGAWSIAPDRFERNCRTWATVNLPGSGLAVSALEGAMSLQARVGVARTLLQRASPDLSWSPTSQPLLVRPAGRGFMPTAHPAGTRSAPMQALIDAGAQTLGLTRRLVLPRGPFLPIRGQWQSAGGPPPGWPNSANEGALWSMAVTGGGQVSWTSRS